MEKQKRSSKQRIQQFAASAQDKVTDLRGKVKDTALKAKADASEFVDETAEKAALAIYKPAFPGEFDMPKMVVISDDGDRKDIEVCQGAIGWFTKAGGIDVLHLYEEALSEGDVTFFPQPQLYSIYYQDALDSKRFISLDCYFDTIQKDKFTELKKIAFDLGAKCCRLESYEEKKRVTIAKPKVGFKKRDETGKTSVEASGRLAADSVTTKSIVFSQTFEGNNQPRRPELKWFAGDEEIEFLIYTRCNGDDAGKTKDYSMKLSSMATQTMSVQAAVAIDKAIAKLGASFNFSLEGEALTEQRRSLVFEIEF